MHFSAIAIILVIQTSTSFQHNFVVNLHPVEQNSFSNANYQQFRTSDSTINDLHHQQQLRSSRGTLPFINYLKTFHPRTSGSREEREQSNRDYHIQYNFGINIFNNSYWDRVYVIPEYLLKRPEEKTILTPKIEEIPSKLSTERVPIKFSLITPEPILNLNPPITNNGEAEVGNIFESIPIPRWSHLPPQNTTSINPLPTKTENGSIWQTLNDNIPPITSNEDLGFGNVFEPIPIPKWSHLPPQNTNSINLLPTETANDLRNNSSIATTTPIDPNLSLALDELFNSFATGKKDQDNQLTTTTKPSILVNMDALFNRFSQEDKNETSQQLTPLPINIDVLTTKKPQIIGLPDEDEDLSTVTEEGINRINADIIKSLVG